MRDVLPSGYVQVSTGIEISSAPNTRIMMIIVTEITNICVAHTMCQMLFVKNFVYINAFNSQRPYEIVLLLLQILR